MDLHDLIIRPLLTEKSTKLRETRNQICFEVRRDANRTQVKQAIEATLNLKVAKVNIINVEGKRKRTGKLAGKRSDWKKAIVSLKAGEKTTIFEG